VHEHDRRRGVEERGEAETGEREAGADERNDERGSTDAAVPADREAREPDGRDELRGAVAFQFLSARD
jgi:hypothetical protein